MVKESQRAVYLDFFLVKCNCDLLHTLTYLADQLQLFLN